MNWYKIGKDRYNLSCIKRYRPLNDDSILFDNNLVVILDSKEERDNELRKLDEALEKGLHTISEFKLP